jgi:cyanophycin synthetase
MTAERVLEFPVPPFRPATFADWRGRLDREQISPVIAIAGSRGKTSVLRAAESIFRAGRCRIASWTDSGVEIEGERQRGELGPWARALTRLAVGGLDIALQELDWTTVQAVGAPANAYPLVAVANLCANNEACLATPDMLQARQALHRLRESVAPSGRLILNADDFAVAGDDRAVGAHRILVGMSAEAPILRRHLRRGGDGCWLAGDQIVVQENGVRRAILPVARMRWTRDGAIPFAVQNALLATAIARGCGVPDAVIARGLEAHDAAPERIPGAFNVFDTGVATIVVDAPASSWFLRTTLRAVSALGDGRQIRVVGPMAEVDSTDLPEVGRLLGRAGGALIVHGHWDPGRLELFRQGAAANDVPPLVAQFADERAAVSQAVAMLRPGDVMLVLAESPSSVVRQIARRVGRRPHSNRNSSGAA